MKRIAKKDIPQLVDRAGELKAMIADAEQELSDIKVGLFNRFGEGAYDGEHYHMTLSSVTSSTLSAPLARQYLSPKEIEKCTVESSSLHMRVYARTRDG